MADLKYFTTNERLPLEMHKVRVVQKLNLLPIDLRLKAAKESHCNTFLLKNRDVFLDMLTDSGVNAMSDCQQASMLIADDSYAGSQTFYRLENTLKHFFGTKYFLPAHQGRACENIISKVFVRDGDLVPMNYHFTTTKAHICANGGEVVELYHKDKIAPEKIDDFKGNVDLKSLEEFLTLNNKKVPFVRIELGTNLIGGQPISLDNIKGVYQICKKFKKILVIDASLLADNLYFIKIREKKYQDFTVHQIILEITKNSDIIYFSARKLGCARGGGIVTNNFKLFEKMKELVPLYEGFLTYGGMSVREMEALAIGLEETLDWDLISQGPEFIEYMTNQLLKHNVPIVLPSGGLGCHLNAMEFVKHINQEQYPAGALAIALYLVSGVRGMERGTLSENRNSDGSEHLSSVELLRLALPKRVFTKSQIDYAVDRIVWLYAKRHLIGGLKFVKEPKVMRFFLGELAPVDDWMEKLVLEFKKDFGRSR